MFEKPRQEKPKTGLNVLRAGLVAAQMLSPYAAEKVEAAEIPKEATWQQGVAELRRSAKEEPIEYAAYFVRFSNGTHAWLPTVEGDVTNVSTNVSHVGAQIQNIRGERKITNLCRIHTHTDHALRTVLKIPNQGAPSLSPPSSTDVSKPNNQAYNTIVDKLPGSNLKRESLFGAVFDSSGVWYYRRLNDKEIRAKDLSLWNHLKVDENFSREKSSIKHEMFGWLRSLPERNLRDAVSILPPPDDPRDRINLESVSILENHKVIESILDHILYSTDTGVGLVRVLVPLSKRGRLDEMRREFNRGIESMVVMRDKREEAEKTILSFQERSSEPTFNVSYEYSQLREAYLHGYQATVRFVSYDDLKKEPPCAGVDHEPKKK